MNRPGRVGRTRWAVAIACTLALPAAACTRAPTLRAADGTNFDYATIAYRG